MPCYESCCNYKANKDILYIAGW